MLVRRQVFSDPTKLLDQCLAEPRIISTGPAEHHRNYDELSKQIITLIQNGQQKAASEIEELRAYYSRSKKLVHALRDCLDKAKKEAGISEAT